MCNRLVCGGSAKLDLLVLCSFGAIQVDLAMLARPLTTVHEFEEFVETSKVSIHFGIVAYGASNIVHLPLGVDSARRGEEHNAGCGLDFWRDVHMVPVW